MVTTDEVAESDFWVWLLEHTKDHRVIQPHEYSQVYPMNVLLRVMMSDFLVEEMKREDEDEAR